MVLMKSLVTVLLFLWYTKPMKLKTRLIITFLTIVLLPTFLTITAFIFIGGYLTRSQQELGFRNSDYSVMIDPAQASSIFLTTITDGAGFFIFLGLATMFLF